MNPKKYSPYMTRKKAEITKLNNKETLQYLKCIQGGNKQFLLNMKLYYKIIRSSVSSVLLEIILMKFFSGFGQNRKTN